MWLYILVHIRVCEWEREGEEERETEKAQKIKEEREGRGKKISPNRWGAYLFLAKNENVLRDKSYEGVLYDRQVIDVHKLASILF